MVGALLVAAGIALAVMGVRLATERPRPANLGGMLLAPAGLLLALVGAGRLLVPGFLAAGGAARPAPVRIMPAGDSITQGSYGAGMNGNGGYRTFLWRRLADAGVAVDFVGSARSGPVGIDRDHEGWNGITVTGLQRRLEESLEAERPDVVLLHVGTNDLIAGAPPEVIEGRLAALVDLIVARRPAARVLVASVVGVHVPNRYKVAREAVAALNARLPRLVAARTAAGARLQFVDMHARALRTPGELHEDGLHPNDRGYAAMADVWLEALRPVLRRGGQTAR